MNRFLGALVDSLVAGDLGYLATAVTGVSVVQYIVVAIVLLTRHSLPFLGGQSIGKKVMKTKAVKLDWFFTFQSLGHRSHPEHPPRRPDRRAHRVLYPFDPECKSWGRFPLG